MIDSSHIAIIVVNWKLKERTAICLRSIDRLNTPHRTIVVDNGSHDGSVPYLRALFPSVELIESPENVGFGRACNQAMQQAFADPNCKFAFLLNNDATIHPEAMNELLAEAQQHPEAGILGAKVYYSHHPQQLWYAGAKCRRFVLAAVDTGRGEIDQGQYDDRREVDFIFGAAMLIRREVYEQVGGFDDQFFLYLEDMDLSLRTTQAGYQLRFVPQAHVWHQGSASTEHRDDWRRYHLAKSTMLFLRKHTPVRHVPYVLVFWFLVLARDVFLHLWQGNLLPVRAYWSGFVNSLKHARELS